MFETFSIKRKHYRKIEDLDVKLKASGYQFKDKQDDNESEVDEKRNDVFTDCMDEEWRDVGDVVESEGVGDVVKSEDENTKVAFYVPLLHLKLFNFIFLYFLLLPCFDV